LGKEWIPFSSRFFDAGMLYFTDLNAVALQTGAGLL
jgi:hypothetical protein